MRLCENLRIRHGQGIGLIHNIPSATSAVKRMMAEAGDILARLSVANGIIRAEMSALIAHLAFRSTRPRGTGARPSGGLLLGGCRRLRISEH
jgi:hypothetical protein